MEGFRLGAEPMGVGLAALLLVASPSALGASIGTESTFGKDVMTQALAYDGHQSLASHPIQQGLLTWNLAGSMTKAGAADQSSTTYGFGAGMGWRNLAWDIGGGLSYSTNSDSNTTSFAPSATLGYRMEFESRRRRRPQARKSPARAVQGKKTPAEELQLESPAPTEEVFVPSSGFKPSLSFRGGVRYEKTTQSFESTGGGSSLPLPIPTDGTTSQNLNSLALSAMLLFNPNPWFAVGGGYTKFSYSQSESQTDALFSQLEDYLGAYGGVGSLQSLGSVGNLGSILSSIPGAGGISPSALSLFGSAYTFGALPSSSLDLILMLFPSSLFDVEMRGNMTAIKDSDVSVKDIRAMFYFHLTEAWTLGAGANHAFSDDSKQTFASASLSYAFY